MDSRTAPRRTPSAPPAGRPAAPTPPPSRFAPPASGASNRATQQEAPPLVGNFLAVARGIALFLGVFSLFNVFGETVSAGFDASLWWIDMRPCPVRIARAFLATAGVLMVFFAAKPTFPTPLRVATIVCLVILLAFATYNATVFYSLVRRGAIQTSVRVPFSVHVAACLSIIMIGLRLKPPEFTSARQAFLAAFTTGVCLVGFPLAQMYSFGNTDYRRPVDAIVVFGCKVNSNNRASWALYDRVRTASALYAEGLADLVILSGGPGEGSRHETDVMKELAIEHGVPESRIVVDRDGLDTASTARNTAILMQERGLSRVLAVSHFYHLPRVKLAYRRAGLDALTVPARQTHRLKLLPYYLAREIAALWLYYFQPPPR